MPPLALLLVLAAAVLHAGWNLAVKASRDRLVTAWMQLVAGGVVGLPFVIVGWERLAPFWWVAVVSAVIECLYILALVAAYERADLAVAYPVARGTAPLLVTLGAWALLADLPSPGGLLAVGLITGGILALAATARLHGLGWALLTGVWIAAYTLIDTAAVRRIGESIPYTGAVVAFGAVLLAPVVLVRRSPAEVAAATKSWRASVTGVFAVVSYALVLVAVGMAPVGLVSALRESSVVIGALGGWLLLGEELGRRRLVGAVLVAAGTLVLAVAA